MQRCICACLRPPRRVEPRSSPAVRLCSSGAATDAMRPQRVLSRSQAELRSRAPGLMCLADRACCSPRCFRAALFRTIIENFKLRQRHAGGSSARSCWSTERHLGGAAYHGTFC